MSDIRFSGLPAGIADTTLRQAGQTAQITADIPAEPVFAERDCFFLRSQPSSQNWLGLSSTTVPGIGYRLGWGVAPPVYRDILRVGKDAPNQIVSNGFSDSVITPLVYIGGQADIYRIENGALNRVRQSRITDGNWGQWYQRDIVSSNGYNVNMASFFGRGRSYWYGVAAIDAFGMLGERAVLRYDLPLGAAKAQSLGNPNIVSMAWAEGGVLPAPENFVYTLAPGGEDVLQLSWDPVPGAVAYVLFQAFTDPATFVPDRFLQLEEDGGVPVRDGDMVILTNRIMEPHFEMKSARTQGDFQSSKALKSFPIPNFLNEPDEPYSYVFGDWTPEDPAPTPALGSSYARIAVQSGSGKMRILQQAWNAGRDQTFYRVATPDERYKWRAWIEADRVVQVVLSFGLPKVPDETITLQPGWQEVVRQVSPVEIQESGPVRSWRLEVLDRQTPVTLRVAGIQFFETSTDFHVPEPAIGDLLVPGQFLRDHSLIKPERQTTDVAALTNPPGESPRETTLESIFRQCAAYNGNPWLQIEWYHTVEDWLDILAYIAAPVSSGHPMALKRQSNGRTAPWTEAFDQIRWEFGNESWNGLSEFWNPPSAMVDAVTGEVYDRAWTYGQICRNAALAMQASPFWSDKIVWVLGGWARQTYSFAIARSFGLPCEIGIANYNGGWDEGNVIVSENDQSYQNSIAAVPGVTGGPVDFLVEGLRAVAEEPGVNLEYGTQLRPTCYEAGPGYQLNGLNGSVVTEAEKIAQEVVMKSRGVATGTLDTMLYQATRGFAMFNFFTTSTGDYWSARAATAHGGGIYPCYGLCQVVMEQMGPCSVYEANPIRPDRFVMEERREGTLIEPESIFVYALRAHADPKRFMVIVGNRNRAKSVPASVLSNLRAVDAMTVWANLGDYREHNRYPVGTRLTPEGGYAPDPFSVDIAFTPQALPVPADPARIDIDGTLGVPGLENGLPPGNALLIRFDGAVFQGE